MVICRRLTLVERVQGLGFGISRRDDAPSRPPPPSSEFSRPSDTNSGCRIGWGCVPSAKGGGGALDVLVLACLSVSGCGVERFAPLRIKQMLTWANNAGVLAYKHMLSLPLSRSLVLSHTHAHTQHKRALSLSRLRTHTHRWRLHTHTLTHSFSPKLAISLSQSRYGLSLSHSRTHTHRCAGGLTLLGAQKSFTHLSGAVHPRPLNPKP